MTTENIDELREEVYRLMRENAEGFRETKEMISDLTRQMGKYDNRWGLLIEALVEGNGQLLPLMKRRGIQVNHSSQRARKRLPDGGWFEVDILLVNGNEIVAVEVKTTLSTEDVDHFIGFQLARFTEFFPEYAGHRLYGAIAFLRSNKGADRYAQSKGLFVVPITGEGIVSIVNTDDFQPVDFNPGI